MFFERHDVYIKGSEQSDAFQSMPLGDFQVSATECIL